MLETQNGMREKLKGIQSPQSCHFDCMQYNEFLIIAFY